MATQITKKAVMIGLKSLSISNAQLDNFNAIALETEEEVTRDLLGDKLWNAFETDVDAGAGTPTQAKHLALLDGVTWIDDENLTVDTTFNLEGLKEAYKYFVYYSWFNQVPFANNFVGKAQNEGENATQMDRQSLNIESQDRYNRGSTLYDNLQQFVEFYETISVDATSIVEAPAGTYTVLLPSTLYLIDTDTVTIETNDFTVENLIANTSFTFDSTAGQTFTDLEVTWHPFEDALLRDRKKIHFNGMF